MKQKLRAAFDANITDGEKFRAGRLAVSLNTERLATAVMRGDNRIEPLESATHAVAF